MNYNKELSQITRHSYQRYARQMVLPEMQSIGQERLHKARILFVGAGGLASATLLYLVASGVNKIGIVDNDIVEISNLHRQIIYNEEDIGSYKVDAAERQLMKMNSQCSITKYNFKLNNKNAEILIKLYDLIVDSTDNFPVRSILSQTCKYLHKVHVYGAIGSLLGQITVFNYQGGLSYNQIYSNKNTEVLKGCSEEGVISVLPGLIGIMQATEVIKIITGIGEVLYDQMLTYNLLYTSFKILKLHPVQYNHKYLTVSTSKLNVNNQQHIFLIDLYHLYECIKINMSTYCLIDLRPTSEYQLSHLQNAINLPLVQMYKDNIIKRISIISQKKNLIIYCNSFIKSHIASQLLLQRNIRHSILEIV